jgi:SNF2 family DNA or RNA helicase
VTKGTIEEKILARQAKKKALADRVIGFDADGFKDLTREELIELFRLDVSNDGPCKKAARQTVA